MLKCVLLAVVVAVMVQNGFAMNEKQMKAAAKLVRNACQPKNKISDEIIDNMHKGIWAGDPVEKCYNHCTLTMLKLTKKNGQIDYEGAVMQIPTLPESRQAPTNASLAKCKDEKVTDDKCENAWRIGKCIYEDNPDNYFLP